MSDNPVLSYSDSIARLKELVVGLEGGQVGVDELESVVKEAVQIITNCRTRLRSTQSSVDSLLMTLKDESAQSSPVPVPTAEVILTLTEQDP